MLDRIAQLTRTAAEEKARFCLQPRHIQKAMHPSMAAIR